MSDRVSLPAWQKWLLLYLAVVAIGSMALLGGGFFPPEWLAGWVWWRRLALVLFVSPLLVVGYFLCELILEAVLHAIVFAFKEHTLSTIVGLLVVVSLIYVGVGLARG
jgi:hypothetical protein